MWLFLFVLVFLLFPGVRRWLLRLFSCAGGLVAIGIYVLLVFVMLWLGFIVGFISFLVLENIIENPKLAMAIAVFPGVGAGFFVGKGAIREAKRIINTFRG